MDRRIIFGSETRYLLMSYLLMSQMFHVDGAETTAFQTFHLGRLAQTLQWYIVYILRYKHPLKGR